MLTIGIDTGGTFTDLVLFDGASGVIRATKVPSTPDDPALAVRQALESPTVGSARAERVVHGTTVATNALIERKGARLALVMTEGFRDLIEIGRTRRGAPGLFNTKFVRPPPLVPRSRRIEVTERLLADGGVDRPLDEASVAAACDALAGMAPEVVVVCLLHAYANPAHERRVGEIVARRLPGVPVILAADVVPEYREFERLTTAVINGYVLPKMEGYLARLGRHLKTRGERLFVMGSNGGILTAAAAAAKPARTILSGPAGGVQGAAMAAAAAGVEDFITCDMGGTSTDVSLVRGLEPTIVHDTQITGLPLKLPQLDINTVGAGGGSIAWVDVDGALRVGPESAGASPGPACYGHGGTELTVTDANLLLGRISSGTLLGGQLALECGLAEAALVRLAAKLGHEAGETLAEGVIRLAVARMASAIREISIERGHDPRQFTLLPMGGAGPMHGCELAQELGMSRVLVPRWPGNLSALGLLGSDIRYDLARTHLVECGPAAARELARALDELCRQGRDLLAADGFDAGAIRVEPFADMRYRGQAFELTVGVPEEVDGLRSLIERFESLYERRYGHLRQGKPIDVVTLRVVASGLVPRPQLAEIARQAGALDSSLKGRRDVHLVGLWHRDCPVFDRDRLGAGAAFDGPAVVEEFGSTTVVPPAWRAAADSLGNLRLSRHGSQVASRPSARARPAAPPTGSPTPPAATARPESRTPTGARRGR